MMNNEGEAIKNELQQTREFVKEVTTSRGSDRSNFAMHSQGNAIVYNGIKYVQENGDFKPVGYYTTEEKIPTFVSFASPMNAVDMKNLIKGEVDEGGLGYTYLGAYTKEGDFAGEVLGGNKGNNGQATLSDKLNILNAYKLFTSNSPHSTYICQDYPDQGVQCGYRK